MIRNLSMLSLPGLIFFQLEALCTLCLGQTLVGTVGGTIRSADERPVEGVKITAHNLTNGADAHAMSSASGGFSIPNLQPGQYEVTADKAGFLKSSAVLEVQAQGTHRVDFLLAPGGADASAPVKAAVLEELSAMKKRIEELEAALKHAPGNTAAAQAGQDQRVLLATTARGPGAIPGLSGLRTRPQDAPVVPAASDPQLLERMDRLEARLAAKEVEPPPAAAQTPKGTTPAPRPPVAPTEHVIPDAMQAPAPAPAVDNFTPFAFGDFTWLNGAPRNKDTVLDTKFFTPEVRFDTHYMEDFNQPRDHTIVGATESFRSGEVQIEQASVGGDFHWQNVRGRILFMEGLFATTTPRNDASFGTGQWDLRGAYKYVSEAYGGYHFDVNHGLNIDAGIFVSYIGLFSYYNFDNWTYQPSYVSSNTPWFFNGVRVQWFPTNKLKIEPWFINGWQSYSKYNGHPGLGGQLLWMPTEWFKLVANQYGFGQDNLGLPHTERIHSDDSIEIRYYNHPTSTGLSKMAFSLTGDAGAQYGGGLCGACAPSKSKESFVGWMLYDRYWFHKDLFAVTFGGGEMSNYGRYLTLLPPINGADAVTGSPYFTANPGQKAHMWDSTVTLQYMPRQYITWWAEVGYRHSDVPYFAGRGGVTPPGYPLGGTNGAPGQFACSNGTPSGASDLATARANCGATGVWFPDLRRSEVKASIGVMVKF